ncbi:hypothetical protein [Leuconostoc citreum]
MIKFNLTIDTIIALFSLVLAAFSILYTFWSNRYSIEIENFDYEKNREHHLISVDFINTSTKNLKLLNLKFYVDDILIETIDFDFEKYDQRKQLESRKSNFPFPDLYTPISNFETLSLKTRLNQIEFPKTMIPNKQYNQCCFLSKKPNKLVVSTNHHISLFSKTKSFSLT